MPVRTANKKRVNYTLDPKLWKKVVEHSEESGFSQSVIVSIALKDYFIKLEKVREKK